MIKNILSIVLLVMLFIISRYNYILYHSIIEMLGIVISCGVFMIAYNAREYMRSGFFIIIGVSFLFVAIIDSLHMLAYKGMGVFQGNDPNLATQLWIALSYLRAVSFLGAPILMNRKIKTGYILLVYTIVTTALIISIFYLKIFPICFIEGSGLTIFKITSEYIISFILLVSFILVYIKRSELDKVVWKLIITSIVITILSEMAFTLYTDVFGFSNFAGHMLELAAFLLIYQAVIYKGLRKPYDLMFRDLKLNEEKLVNALSEIKILQAILPICASCKKIRNAEGGWQMVEEYISEHTDTKFSHGICEACAQKLYPGVFK